MGATALTQQLGKGGHAAELGASRIVIGFDLQAETLAQCNTQFQRIDGIQSKAVAKQWNVIGDVFYADVFQFKCLDDQLLDLKF
ncbi:hypothetical protein MB84_18220 [Pandoraea oxalativorans]|uniref:Uncharacterized protein n=1 Tax=Pandoraea oxalativorans TaxID=573737 RepID=A0A0E3U847_9BURK|nr:hypothetical protein MB84_18220 [Pandoraea oxalativorans]